MAKQSTFTTQERNRIRRALEAYMAAHKIRVPTLLARMENALERTDLPYLKLSTLQRFIRGTSNPGDEKVLRYKKFLERVAPPPAEDELGRALAAFVPSPFRSATWSRRFAGLYTTYTRPCGDCTALLESLLSELVPETGCHLPFRIKEPHSEEVLHSVLYLQPGNEDGFLRATEIRGGALARIMDENGTIRESWIGNTGLFIQMGPDQFLVMMRSCLDARLYLLKKTSAKPIALSGVAFMSEGSRAFPSIPKDKPLSPAFEIRITPVEQAKA